MRLLKSISAGESIYLYTAQNHEFSNKFGFFTRLNKKIRRLYSVPRKLKKSYPASHQVIKNLIEDNNKFVSKIQEKDKTIQKLKDNLEVLSAEVETQIASESVKADIEAREKAENKQQFSTELSNIKDTLDSSHRELTQQVKTLHVVILIFVNIL